MSPRLRRARPLRVLLLLLAVLLSGGARVPAAQNEASHRPKLVLLIAIDQFRADYLVRFRDLYLPSRSGNQPGGFRYLMERGAWFPDCRYEHYRTITGVGHAILSTGAQPGVDGIVGNAWWDRAAGKSVYCAADPDAHPVTESGPSPGTGMSPANLLVSTVGDELKLATGGRSRCVSLSLKDRAAIMLGGHRPDVVLWTDGNTGQWVSSTYYCRSGRLPGWATSLNAEGLPDRLRARPWTPSVPEAALRRVWNPEGKPVAFSHPLAGGSFTALETSPEGNALLFHAAERAVDAEQLGRHETPDLLTLNLASNDYVGHAYGPDSAEVLDISVRTDRQLSEFLGYLDRTVPGGLADVTVAISADHGVGTIPELNAASGVPARRAVLGDVRRTVEDALAAVGPGPWIASMENEEIYLRTDTLARFPQVPLERVEAVAAVAAMKVAGVYLAVGKSAVLEGRVPQTALGRRLSAGVHPRRSGDVILIFDPNWLPGSRPTGSGASHGSPWPYDTNVPLLLAGFGVRPGVYGEAVSPARIAPTLAHLLGIARPSGADEPLLPCLDGVR